MTVIAAGFDSGQPPAQDTRRRPARRRRAARGPVAAAAVRRPPPAACTSERRSRRRPAAAAAAVGAAAPPAAARRPRVRRPAPTGGGITVPPLPPIPGPVPAPSAVERGLRGGAGHPGVPQGLVGPSRHGTPAHPSAAPPPRARESHRPAGRSVPARSFNLGDHVGDDPADVAANRASRLAGGRPRARRRTGWSG